MLQLAIIMISQKICCMKQRPNGGLTCRKGPGANIMVLRVPVQILQKNAKTHKPVLLHPARLLYLKHLVEDKICTYMDFLQ